jgi:hypothetical protein
VFLVQHGHGNGGNVDRAIAAGDAAGVIWSPCNYIARSLRREIKRNAPATQMLDPQLYVAYAPGLINARQLDDYPWYSTAYDKSGKRRPLTPAVVSDIVTAALDFQRNISELTEIVAPSPALSSSGTGGQLNRLRAFGAEAVSNWQRTGDGRPLFISLPIEGPLLEAGAGQERLAVVGMLNKIQAAGIYFLADLDPALDASTYATRLANALWLVNRLSANKRVRVGYTGLNGWLFRAAGAEATAAGWFQNRRFWSTRNWLDRSGGSRLERAALQAPLALLTPADLATVRDANLQLYQRLVAGAGPLAAKLRASPPQAADVISLELHAAQLFAVCHELDRRVGSGFQTDARRIIADVTNANTLRNQIASTALTIEGAASDGRPSDWETALRKLAKQLGVQL